MMVLAAEYNDKLGRKPGAIRVVAEKDKDFTSCCFENISDDEVKKNNFRLYPMSYQSRHENKRNHSLESPDSSDFIDSYDI